MSVSLLMAGTGIVAGCEYVDPRDDAEGYFDWCRRCIRGTPRFSGGLYYCTPPDGPVCPQVPSIPAHVHCTTTTDNKGCQTFENCQPDCFYSFASKTQGDLTVKWAPESTCSRWPHVHAGKRVPEADEGWIFAYPSRAGDYTVKPRAPRTGIEDAN